MKANLMTTRILEIGRTFVTALSVRDFQRLQTAFHEDVQFRALVPEGIRGSIGSAETVAWLRRWFGSADEFQWLDSSVDQVADRLHIVFCILIYQNEEWQIVEQHAYCTVSEGGITAMNLVATGFRPNLDAVYDLLTSGVLPNSA